MKKRIGLVLIILIVTLVFAASVSAADKTVSVKLPSFKVTLNGQEVNNDYSQYPLIVYKDITYFPMTYNDCRFLGVSTEWIDATKGLFVNLSGEQGEYLPYTSTVKNTASNTASIVSFPVTINGNAIDNSTEQYPLLNFRDITYFPMTWRFCVDEFGWNYSYTNETGLVVTAHKHQWDSGVVTSEATCTTDGSIVYTCASCGDSKTESIPKTGHSYKETFSGGKIVHTCSVCGDSYTEEIEALKATVSESGRSSIIMGSFVSLSVGIDAKATGGYGNYMYKFETYSSSSSSSPISSLTKDFSEEATYALSSKQLLTGYMVKVTVKDDAGNVATATCILK